MSHAYDLNVELVECRAICTLSTFAAIVVQADLYVGKSYFTVRNALARTQFVRKQVLQT